MSDQFESALRELIDKITPGLDSGDILADARTASESLSANTQAECQYAKDTGMWPEHRCKTDHCEYVDAPTQGADARPVACPECGGSLTTWKCTCEPIWPGYATSDAAPSNTVSEEMLTQGVKALLNCTMGELECVSPKLLDSYEADVKRVYEAMRVAIVPREKT
jgi:hypothetical protein